MVMSGIANWAVLLCPSLVMRLNGSFSKALKRHVTLPAMYSTNKNAPLKLFGLPFGLLPTRAESLIIFLLWVYMILGSSIGFHHVSGNFMWNRAMSEMGNLIGDRAGMLALFVYPMLILFASRNNVLMFFTRWSYTRFNTLHRHMARIFLVLVMAHGIAMTISMIGVSTANYKESLTGYVLWGISAASLMGFIVIQSILLVRRKSYEAFLIVHIVLAIAILISIHYHINSFGLQGFTWSTIGIWALDRVIRLIRMFSFGVKEASVKLIAGETVKVTVPKPKHWNAKPGQYAFVSFMMPACFWQSHPFTAISTNENELSFAIKVKGGVTLSLYKHLVSMPSQTAKIKVCIEGPYGFSSPAQKYSQSLLMASGNGIPGMYDHAMRLATTSTKHSVKLIWIMRNYKSLSWMYEEMKKLGSTKVETIVYVTRPNDFIRKNLELFGTDSTGSESDRYDESKEEVRVKTEINSVHKLQESLPHIEFREGRPDIDGIIVDEISLAQGSVAVVTCGHDSMVDAIRHAVVNSLDATSHRVDYFEELQIWA
ncbi:hypothetical protein BABINDRAFT_163900 [Babjeviella inositovora NRRL Y-12698]|uniref:ferric-chelate reductase (NADPH) n=1 Tax=Babjeviella inositovora NRRL Y-12698 TaxID=984486 RepID=A0A1E3QH25_9ASCO|nr:uncharacterized protein BABINDRAFT_163900 [Babjeviella inositovora NRRL Y-12698]ODQ76999.1 hypothetical protein BABINDRAFT_163900 [Babjeviella inositovora NRRL Y-12698]